MAQQEFILGWLGGLGTQPLLGHSKGSNNGLYEISQMGVVARGASTKLDLRNSLTLRRITMHLFLLSLIPIRG